MSAPALDVGAARTALAGACDDVAEAGPADAVDGVATALVARPASTAEVAEVLRAAAAAGLTVVARGSGTKLTWGRPPERADLVVDLARMDRVQDHAAGDLIVDVQAGRRCPPSRRRWPRPASGWRSTTRWAGPRSAGRSPPT